MISIFVNPQAGKGKALKVSAVLEKMLAEREISFLVHILNWPINLEDCHEAWIVGGDGTLNYFINKYRDIKIPLAIFKGGTGDDLAWKLYGDLSVPGQVELVLAATPKPVDAGCCNGRLFINVVGIGFDGEVLRSMAPIRRMGGHLGYLWVVIRKIFSFREPRFKISAAGICLDENFLIVSISNSCRTGGGFMISPLAEMNDGKLNLVLCKPLPVIKRLLVLPLIEKGKHLSLPFIIHKLVDKIVIETAADVLAQLDGELIQSNYFNIHIVPDYCSFKY